MKNSMEKSVTMGLRVKRRKNVNTKCVYVKKREETKTEAFFCLRTKWLGIRVVWEKLFSVISSQIPKMAFTLCAFLAETIQVPFSPGASRHCIPYLLKFANLPLFFFQLSLKNAFHVLSLRLSDCKCEYSEGERRRRMLSVTGSPVGYARGALTLQRPLNILR